MVIRLCSDGQEKELMDSQTSTVFLCISQSMLKSCGRGYEEEGKKRELLGLVGIDSWRLDLSILYGRRD